MSGQWDEPKDDEGITLGAEEALQREIEKTKALKVERLQLRDQVEKLQAQVQTLAEKINNPSGPAQPTPTPTSADHLPGPAGSRLLPAQWAIFLFVFNLLALGLLVFLLLQP